MSRGRVEGAAPLGRAPKKASPMDKSIVKVTVGFFAIALLDVFLIAVVGLPPLVVIGVSVAGLFGVSRIAGPQYVRK